MKTTRNKSSESSNKSAAKVEKRQKNAAANLKMKYDNIQQINPFKSKKYLIDENKQRIDLIGIIGRENAKALVNLGRDNLTHALAKYRGK